MPNAFLNVNWNLNETIRSGNCTFECQCVLCTCTARNNVHINNEKTIIIIICSKVSQDGTSAVTVAFYRPVMAILPLPGIELNR